MAKTLRHRFSNAICIALSLVLLGAAPAFARKAATIRLEGALAPGAPARVSVDELEQLEQAGYETFNPFVKATNRYAGVLLRTLVTSYGAPGVSRIVLTAIDDYQTEFTAEEWGAWDILLATRVDGERMGVKEQGPAKIVLPYDQQPELNQREYNRKWIWMIKSIRFEAGE